jgi:histone deacetylase 11
MSGPLRVFYSPQYDIRFFGIERLHPFDSCKYSHAWNAVRATHSDLKRLTQRPDAPVSDADLLMVHPAGYLERLRRPAYVSLALELPLVAAFPIWLINRHVLRPMRLATRGTVLAARHAITTGGVGVNLSGGYHHASPERGEGFCVFSDIPVAVECLRRDGLLDRRKDTVLLIDLDAHQGNGYERAFRDDDRLVIYDQFNEQIYPRDTEARKRINYPVPVQSGIGDAEYQRLLTARLTACLDSTSSITLAFYNAGTDIHQSDRLGHMNLTDAGIFERDRFVLDTLAECGIPCVVTLSGGYSAVSYELVARMLMHLLERDAAAGCGPFHPLP